MARVKGMEGLGSANALSHPNNSAHRTLEVVLSEEELKKLFLYNTNNKWKPTQYLSVEVNHFFRKLLRLLYINISDVGSKQRGGKKKDTC